MANSRFPATPRVDRDGVRTQRSGVRTSVWLLAAALAIIGMVLFVIVRPAVQPLVLQPTEQTAKLAAATPAWHPAMVTPIPQKVAPPAPIEASRPVRPKSAPQAQQVAQAALPPGAVPDYDATPEAAPEADSDEHGDEPSGIDVFPPRGAKAIKYGIIVPDDFELPPGYVRHYQATDDGYQLPPVLMFDENYQPVDAHGRPIPLPADRVVPPELAPPGMPVQVLQPRDGEFSGATAPKEGDQSVPPPGGIRHRN